MPHPEQPAPEQTAEYLIKAISERVNASILAIGAPDTLVGVLTMLVMVARQKSDRSQWLALCGDVWDAVDAIPEPTARGGKA